MSLSWPSDDGRTPEERTAALVESWTTATRPAFVDLAKQRHMKHTGCAAVICELLKLRRAADNEERRYRACGVLGVRIDQVKHRSTFWLEREVERYLNPERWCFPDQVPSCTPVPPRDLVTSSKNYRGVCAAVVSML